MTGSDDLDAASLAAEATGGPTPNDAASAAESAAEAGGEAAAEAAEADSKGIIGALLHTSPDADPRQVAGPAWIGHTVVGIRKVMDAMGIEAGEGDGTPALMNFYKAAMLFYQGLQQRQAEQDDDGQPEVNVRGQ